MTRATWSQIVKAWLPALAWMVVISLASTDAMSAEHTSRIVVPFLRWLHPGISPHAIDLVHTAIRKGGHVTEYAILAALFWRAFNRASKWAGKYGPEAIAVLLIAAAYASADEFHQHFVPTRTASPRDVLIDTCGAALSVAVCWAWSRRKNPKVES